MPYLTLCQLRAHCVIKNVTLNGRRNTISVLRGQTCQAFFRLGALFPLLRVETGGRCKLAQAATSLPYSLHSQFQCWLMLKYFVAVISLFIKSQMERCGRIVNTPSSCSGGPGLKSRPGDRLSWSSFFSWFSSVPPGECGDSTIKLGHDYLQVIFNLSLTHHPICHSLITLSFDAI
jgi:hypothetical protein